MPSKRTLFAVYCCALVSLSSALLYGQATGSFSGTVTIMPER
jgi:hypothetical protein